MSTTTISQVWPDDEQHAWSVQLTVTGTGLDADDIAALEPVIAAIETYTRHLDCREAAP